MYDIWYTIKYYKILYTYIPCLKYDCLHTQDTTGSLQYHLSYVVCGEVRSFCPFDNLYTCSVKLFNLPNWTYQALGVYQCTSTDVSMYEYQYNVSAQCTWHLAYQVYQATRPHLPGPTRPYQDLPEPSPTRPGPPKRPHAGSHTFLAAPKNTSKTTYFFWHTFEKAKTYILHCKMYVFLEIAKNWQKMHQNLAFQQLTFQKHTFYSVKCMFLTLGLKFQAWNLEISFQNWKKNMHFTV